MKIVLPGGSGQVGTLLARAFHARGDDVVVLSRTPIQLPWRVVAWDARTHGAWAQELEGADVVINLAGRSVNCRYTPSNRDLIMRSRVDSTVVVGEAIAAAAKPPRIWLQASTATIYSHRYDAPNDEATGLIGGDEPGAPSTWRFSTDVARAWEDAADRFALPATRVVKLRSAMVMSPDEGGIFATLLALVRLGLGGQSGNGKQYISWIHERDFIASLDWIVGHADLSGAINIASPNPLPNAEFMRVLRRAWGAPVGLPATKWMLEVGALVLQTETELVLKSRRVVPGTLLRSGFCFEFPDWESAANELCGRWREPRRSGAA